MKKDTVRLEPLGYRIKEAAQVSGLSRGSIYNAVKAGKLELRKVGAASIIPAASLRALIAGEG